MNFLDGHLFPENQQPLIITAAPYAPSWLPSDFPGEIAVTMEEQIQKAVDCYNAGATVLHLHVRELDGKGSKRLSKFNELIAGVRARVPEMIIQVGGSISFAPETDGAAAKWLSDDTRHMLAELQPVPDQVTVTINTSQMNFLEQFDARDIRGTSMEDPVVFNAYREMTVPAQPGWAEAAASTAAATSVAPLRASSHSTLPSCGSCLAVHAPSAAGRSSPPIQLGTRSGIIVTRPSIRRRR